MRKAILGTASLVALALALAASGAHAAPARTCGDNESGDDLTSLYGDDIASHRMFEVKPIVFDKGDNASYQVNVTLLVNADGSVKCVQLPEDDISGSPFDIHYPDDAIRAAVGQWRYEPYHDGGKAVPFSVSETLIVTHAPVKDTPMPEAGPEATATLSHGDCFGTCPAYTVTIHGDGSIDYSGQSFVGVTGDLHYKVPKTDADVLFAHLREDNIWSAQDAYVGAETDAAHTLLTFNIGGQTKTIHDYLGADAGMPEVVTQAEAAIDGLAAADRWIHVGVEGLADLDAMHFDYTGPAGASLLVNVLSDDQSDNAVALALLDRHVSLAGGSDWAAPDKVTLPLDAALGHGRSEVVLALIKAGALLKDGKTDPERVDSAFQAAVQSGDVASAKVFGPMHPALTYPYAYTDYGTDPATDKTKDISVLFLIDGDNDQSLDMYNYLISLGADAKARDQDGSTLIMKLGANTEIVKSLIGLGIDVNAKDDDGATALLQTGNEETALLLLQAGADPTVSNDFGDDIFSQADFYDWSKVKAWLKAHNIKPKPKPAG